MQTLLKKIKSKDFQVTTFILIFMIIIPAIFSFYLSESIEEEKKIVREHENKIKNYCELKVINAGGFGEVFTKNGYLCNDGKIYFIRSK